MKAQPHILFLYKFPEDDSEVFMIYMKDELEEALKDASNFHEMYKEVLYVSIASVNTLEEERELWRWNNPKAESLISRLSSAGLASLPLPTISGSAPYAGPLSQTASMAKRTISPLGARPPLEGQYDSPLPATSPIYGGRKRGRRNQ